MGMARCDMLLPRPAAPLLELRLVVISSMSVSLVSRNAGVPGIIRVERSSLLIGTRGSAIALLAELGNAVFDPADGAAPAGLRRTVGRLFARAKKWYVTAP